VNKLRCLLTVRTLVFECVHFVYQSTGYYASISVLLSRVNDIYFFLFQETFRAASRFPFICPSSLLREALYEGLETSRIGISNSNPEKAPDWFPIGVLRKATGDFVDAQGIVVGSDTGQF